jgi:hypothetical protein
VSSPAAIQGSGVAVAATLSRMANCHDPSTFMACVQSPLSGFQVGVCVPAQAARRGPATLDRRRRMAMAWVLGAASGPTWPPPVHAVAALSGTASEFRLWGGARTEPNRMIWLLYAGAAILAANVISLGVGRSRPCEPTRRDRPAEARADDDGVVDGLSKACSDLGQRG